MVKRLLRRWRWFLSGAVALFLAIQVIPYGRAHADPPVLSEPAWDSPQTRALAMRACGDCHSNQTAWPWYSNIAPISWVVQQHVAEGRSELNFSDWARADEESDDVVEVVLDGSMPPWYYTPLHPGARLSPAERDALVRGFEATLRNTAARETPVTSPGSRP